MRILFILSLFFVACLPPKALPTRRPNNEAIKIRSELETSEENREELNSKLDKIKEENNRLNAEKEKLEKNIDFQKKVFHVEQTKLKKQIYKMKRPVVAKEVITAEPTTAPVGSTPIIKAPTSPITTIKAAATPIPTSTTTTTTTKPKPSTMPEYSPSDAP